MKNNRKGFTLIELLAVIVILAIIALIATPIIMGVINDSKKGAAKDSMYAYVKAAELASARGLNSDSDLLSGEFLVKSGNVSDGIVDIMTIDLKGTKPSDDSGDIIFEKGQVIKADLKFDGYCVGYEGGKATNKETCTPTKKAVYPSSTIIYYNPETNKKCASGEVNANTNAKTGCLKWYVLSANDNEINKRVKVILDHNTTSKIGWLIKEDYLKAGGDEASWTNGGMIGFNELGPITIKNKLISDSATWNWTVKNNTKLVDAQEIADVVGNTTWVPDGTLPINAFSMTWLFDNLSGSNTDELPGGYWTATSNGTDKAQAWAMMTSGRTISDYIVDTSWYGVRPVVIIDKNIIK